MKRIIKIFLIIVLSFTIVNAKEVDFSINDIEVVDSSTSALVGTPSFVSNKIDADTLLNEKEDYVIYNVNIKNNDSENYKLIKIEDNNTNSTINISYDSDTKTINSKDNINLTVKVTYSKLVKNIDKKSLKDFDVILVLQDTKGDIYERIINPDTGDNIIIYIVLFIVSLIGLMLILNDKKKTGLVVFIILFVLSPLLILGKEEYRVPFKFSNISAIGVFDEYNIIIDYGNGTMGNKNIKYGDKIGTLSIPNKDGYNFVKFVDQNGNTVSEDTVITGPISITAVYSIINYNIIYNLDGGSSTNVNTYTVEDEITLNNPTKVGYTFIGWSEGDSTELKTNMTISRGSMGDKRFTAHYSANTNTPYLVIHKQMDFNGQYVEYEREELTGTTDQNTLIHTKNYEGFISPVKVTVPISANGDTVVTYEYVRKKYSLTITNSDDVLPSDASNQYYYDYVVTLTAKDKDGYTFSKWSNNDTSKVINYTIKGDSTLEALYNPNKYTIVFNANTGTGSMNNLEVDYDETKQLTANSFVKEHFEFMEWNTKADGTGTSYEDGASIKNLSSQDGNIINLYAIWGLEHREYDEQTFDGSNYINTGIKLFNDDNYQKNFEISVDITDFDSSLFNVGGFGGTVFNSLLETSPYPGIVFRINNKKWELKATLDADNKNTITFDKDTVDTIKVIRIDKKIYYSVNRENPKLLLDMTDFAETFDIPLVFGASVQLDGNPYEPNKRNLHDVTLDNMSIKFLKDDADISDYNNMIDFEEVYRHDGDYTFDGSCNDIITPTHNNGDPVYLYTSDTYLKDFEISFKLGSYVFSELPSQATIVNSKYENKDAGYPGFAVRFLTNTDRLQISSNATSSDKNIVNFPIGSTQITIYRSMGKLYYSVDGGSKVFVHNLKTFNNFFNTPLVIGGNIDDTGNNYGRCFKGTISDIVVKVEK